MFFIFLLCCPAGAEKKADFTLSAKLLAAAERQYGAGAGRRLVAWQELIRAEGDFPEAELLKKINDFFNQVAFVEDAVHWKKSDYWATPVEFLASGAGDCEDFSLAKYFTLKAMGVSEEKLNLTYVKAIRLNQAHMVLTYHAAPEAEPLVLDNLVPDILPASARQDLVPVYSFNGTGLWLAQARGKGQRLAGSDRLKRWRDLLKRMPEGL